MNDQEIHNYFIKLTEEDTNSSDGIAAIRTLLTVLEKTNCKNSTYSEITF